MPPTPPEKTYKTISAGAFVQPDGPNTATAFLPCVDVDDIPSNYGGVNEQINRFDLRGGYMNEGFTTSPPDGVEINVMARLRSELNALDRVVARSQQCPQYLYTLTYCGGVVGGFGNWERATASQIQRITTVTHQNPVKIEEDLVKTKQYALALAPKTFDFAQFIIQRQSVVETQAINAMAFNDYSTCASCDGAKKEGDIGMMGCDAVALATANVLYGSNGATFTATATDPFAADEIVSAVVRIDYNGITRWIVARGTTDAGNPAEIAYSDDNGATWSNVNVGSSNGQFMQSPQALFAFDANHIWAVTTKGGGTGGYVYFSSDGGVSWAAQESGVATSEDLSGAHFWNYQRGYAFGENNALLVTYNGGSTWSALTGPSAQAGDDIYTLAAPFELGIQLGYEDGRLYTSNDGGDTWNENSFTGSGTGNIKAVRYVSEIHGLMAKNSAGGAGSILRTINGGKNWETVNMTQPITVALNDLQFINDTLAWAAGEPQGGTAVLLKIFAP